MQSVKMGVFVILCVVTSCGLTMADAMNGYVDNARDDLGLYYQITGGIFENGQTYNGDNASGGVFRFIHDDPDDATYSYAFQQWARDDWFVENAGLALTMKNQGDIIYNNNGIETDTHDGYYDDSQTSIAGLYMSYAMSNNYDWIYSGYFKLTETTVVDTLIGYFDGTGYYGNFDPDNPLIGYRMNIWGSEMDQDGYLMPSADSFTGDVFSSDNVAGTFSWSDTGVVRKYSGWGGRTDPIYRLVCTLDTPITLEAGEYFFSHDAIIVPVPAAALLGLLGLSVAGVRLRRRV